MLKSQKRTRTPRWLIRVSPLLVVGIFLGCGTKTASVSGKVTYQGKTLTSGTVTFYSQDAKLQGSGNIGSDGTYTVTRAPVGKVKATVVVPVVVNPPAPAMKMDPAKMGSPEISKEAKATAVKPVAIPDKYSDPQNSGLEYEIKSQSNEINIELK
jgi:hypothetical protein